MFKLMGFNVFIQTTDIIEGPCKVPGIEEKKKKKNFELMLYFELLMEEKAM